MTVGEDNELVWIVKITGDNEVYKLASEDITLSGNNYDGKVLFLPNRGEAPISEMDKQIDLSNGGTIGSIGNFSFAISRNNSNSYLQNFFNEFYPATSGQRIVSAQVDIGCVWQGATAESDITWLEQGYVRSYEYSPRVMYLGCEEISELRDIELPYYNIQKDFDNGVSYFPEAPEENLGKPIPIIYGDYSGGLTSSEIYGWSLMPGMVVDSTKMKFIFASHECYNIAVSSPYVYQYLSGLKAYLGLVKSSGVTALSDERGSTIELQTTIGQIYGEIKIPMSDIGSFDASTDLHKILNYDETDYGVIGTHEYCVLKPPHGTLDGSLSSDADLDVAIYFKASSSDGTTRNVTVDFKNPSTAPKNGSQDTGVGTNYPAITNMAAEYYYAFGTITTGQDNDAGGNGHLPWRVSDVLNLEYFIYNEATGDVRIYSAYLHLKNIRIGSVINNIIGYWQLEGFRSFKRYL